MTEDHLQDCVKLLEQSGQYRVVKRFETVESYSREETDATKLLGLYVDVETTGLNAGTDKIIELAMVTFEFTSDGRIFRILDHYDEFQDPGFPIPDGIVALTGITDDTVRGRQIDAETVTRHLDSASVVIAHNAEFDRTFLEREFPVFEKKAWACSIHDIPWSERGIEGAKLEYIAYRLGFFFDGHRAINDCLAGVHVLAQKFPESEDSILKSMLDKARQNEYRIWALGSPFDSKDILKSRKYRWNAGDNDQPKSWYIDVSGDVLQSEINFLHQQIYGREVELRIDLISAYDRYTDRTKRYPSS